MRLYVAVGLASFFLALLMSPAAGEDIPAFRSAFGQPAVEPMQRYLTEPWGYTAQEVAPPISVDGEQIVIGGRDIGVFEATGEWLDFFSFCSPVHGLGDLDPYLPADESFRWVWDVDIGPDGEVVALDQNYAAIHRYSAEGIFLNGWGGREGDWPGRFYQPVALSVGPDASVYVLDAGPGRIQRFTAAGEVLAYWNTPTAAGSDVCEAIDIAADAGGVWALVQTSSWYGDYGDCRVHRYSPDGVEQGSWSPVAETARGSQIEVDEAGNVWVLFLSEGDVRLRRFAGDGTLLTELGIDPDTEGFAISPDSEIYLLVSQYWEWYPGGSYASYRIEVKDFGGTTIRTLGDASDMRARGANAAGRTLAVSPEGDTYTREMSNTWPVGYVSHYDFGGNLMEVIDTNDCPVYYPATEAVEFVDEDELFGTPGPDGMFYHLGLWSYEGGQWIAVVVKYDSDGEKVAEMRIPGPATSEGAYDAGSYSCQFGPDGHLRLVLLAVDSDYAAQFLWCGTVTTEGNLIGSWSISPPGPDAYVGAVTVDGGSNVYITFYQGGSVWVHKYSPRGAFIGRVGKGDGEAQSEATLLYSVGAMGFDALGCLRVLDRAANRILVFAYTPAPFPDVPYWHWAKDAVRAAVEAEIVAGYEDGLYRPAEEVTRAQMAVYVARAMCHGESNVPQGPPEPTFSDVGEDHWAYDHVEYCAETGVVEGYANGTYAPLEEVNRAQMAVYIARAVATPTGEAGLEDYDPGDWSRFPDVTSSFWAYKHIAYVYYLGIVQGYPDGTYRPGGVVTRDQMAVYVARAFELPM